MKQAIPEVVELADITKSKYKTKNIIIVVIDGPRYSETWGDSSHQYIPFMANDMAKNGIISTNFHNDGPTVTNAGHVAITTGVYENIDNNGFELPEEPSIFQHWLASNNQDSTASWIITSIGKLEILSDCKDIEWQGVNNPSTSCGFDGLGSGQRNDSLTFVTFLSVMATHRPQLVLINFREPDYSAHQNNWGNYIQGIIDTDEYTHRILNFIDSNLYYAGTTTLFVTNDHGRHINGNLSGYINHGDDCIGCRHINFYASGPDFTSDTIISTTRSLIDIPATVAELLQFEMPDGEGEIMYELFE
ncbi:MAG: sulfatase [Flavobacteriales bacterium]|nr:sulfatase [Flavobacteriales bacterium]